MSQQNVNTTASESKESSFFKRENYRATYSPDDNKLRLYSLHRLDEDTYQRVKDAGFKYAPRQALFVAPMWTPDREDLLIELAGEIEDEDQTLFDRQEERAERFEEYSEKRAAESGQVLAAVDSLASAVPFGQPILVGHHSERRARKHAQKIENGMRRAVNLFETSEYWERRAEASLRHAAYKERPDVRWRRIKKIEADLRKADRRLQDCQKFIKLWSSENLNRAMALVIANVDHLHCCFTLEKYPRPPEKSQYEGSRSIWSALEEDIITAEQARDICIPCHERTITRLSRWTAHYRNRIAYERAMLDEHGGVLASDTEMVPGGQVKSRGEWLTIIRVNRSGGKISSLVTPEYSFMGREGATTTITPDRITEYKAPSAEEAKAAKAAAKRPPIVNYPGEGFVSMTKEEWSKKHADFKQVKGIAAGDDHKAYRIRRVMSTGYTLSPVYITDMKTVEVPR
ncbi:MULTISPECIES: DUF3560 domain-containing protein [Mixta]|uniref:DUF3560 domain-containing protein n=1 Tax=Mixta hanseatica TaxID=2872648 RepID=A0ABY4RDN1_9GAMM|nr:MULTISPECIES: DUF3560 domain-containing protein [Mixta]MDU3818815.1 DUF3560 domain-containing protein [Pantoea sp.]MDU5191122.1 DUF3560 domain-containing protein [Mixta calida]UQY46284.1 DUF3560 domain-containing protein [Mixta hanseatica]HBM9481138.1 DUF3560 domain-containing protein [Klebsiella oxytoca]